MLYLYRKKKFAKYNITSKFFFFFFASIIYDELSCILGYVMRNRF